MNVYGRGEEIIMHNRLDSVASVATKAVVESLRQIVQLDTENRF